MLKLYTYTTERPFMVKLIAYLLLISVFGFFISIFFYGIGYNSLLLIIPIIVIFIFPFIKFKDNLSGEISFNKDSVQIDNYKGKHEILSFYTLRKIIIEYGGYKGRNDSNIFNPFLINGGMNNEIIIYKKNGEKLNIGFYIKDPLLFENLIKLLKKVDNVEIEIIESNSRKRIYKNY